MYLKVNCEQGDVGTHARASRTCVREIERRSCETKKSLSWLLFIRLLPARTLCSLLLARVAQLQRWACSHASLLETR